MPGRKAPLALVTCYLIGAGAAVLGLVPWLVTGMRLPLQNLWAVQEGPGQMPIVLLPFSQYFLTTLSSLLVAGGVFAGVTARVLARRLPERGWSAILFGTVLVQLFAVVQTAMVVRAGLQERPAADLYLALLVGLCVFAMAVGVLVLVLVARAPRAGVLVGLGIGAVMSSSWLNALVVATLGSSSGQEVGDILGVIRWVPAVLVGAAIGWAGVGSVGRAAAAAGNLVALWVVPALITAVTSAAGSRVLAPHPREMLEYGYGVFVDAVLSFELAVQPLLVAVVVASLGLWVERLLRTPVAGVAGPDASDDEPTSGPAEELSPLR